MCLIHIADSPKWRWGYKDNEKDIALAKEFVYYTTQNDDESRDEFFERVGDEPDRSNYGIF